MKLEEAVWSDPERMGGALCFRGTRVPVIALFDHLETGDLAEFHAGFPGISDETVSAVLFGAYDLLAERYGLVRAA